MTAHAQISRAQALLEMFHTQGGGHHGMGHSNPFQAHADWHARHVAPLGPEEPNGKWGSDLPFGTLFLEMHHEMVMALQHFYKEQREPFPPEWDLIGPIPEELSYTPRLEAFPADIRAALVERSGSFGMSVDAFLSRNNPANGFQLPPHYTLSGGSGSKDKYTNVSRLGDFLNTNQLGCCMAMPHAAWHERIGGAMLFADTSIADPIFYWGVHLTIDRIYQTYLKVKPNEKDWPHILMAPTGPPMDRAQYRKEREEDLRRLRSFEKGLTAHQYRV